MTLDMQKSLKIACTGIEPRKDIFPEHTLEMHRIGLVIQQVPVDDTCAFGGKFGAEWTPKHRRRHDFALQVFASLSYRRVHLEERIHKSTKADRQIDNGLGNEQGNYCVYYLLRVIDVPITNVSITYRG